MQTQKETVEALMKPETYEENPGKIEMVQTHISYVFLTKNFVYKVKKAVNFGFLDFETLEKRRFFCEKELQLNKRLCGDMYLEVDPINKSETIKINGKGETGAMRSGLFLMRRFENEADASRKNHDQTS